MNSVSMFVKDCCIRCVNGKGGFYQAYFLWTKWQAYHGLLVQKQVYFHDMLEAMGIKMTGDNGDNMVLNGLVILPELRAYVS